MVADLWLTAAWELQAAQLGFPAVASSDQAGRKS